MTKDIRGGKRNDWDNCPIARAMKRVYPGNDVQVFDEHLLINGTEFAHTDDTREYSEGWNEGSMRPATLTLPDEIGDALRVQNGEVRDPAT